MGERILFVDDEPSVLQAYRRVLRKKFVVVPAQGGKEALRIMTEEGPFPVIVSDMQMPEMRGDQLLSIFKEKYPDTVRLMLTGNADQHTAISAINTADVFRFLNKPCPAEQMIPALESALDYHQLLQAEKVLLENTVKGSIQAMVEVLSIVNPRIFGHVSSIKGYVCKCAEALGLPVNWELESAALLSQVGAVTLPENVIDRALKGEPLSSDEQAVYQKHPEVGAQLIEKIPRLENISQTIRYQNKGFDGSGFPADGVKGADIPLGARILKLVQDLLAGEAGGLSHGENFALLKTNGHLYDPEILQALETVVSTAAQQVVKKISVAQLSENMVVAKDVVSFTGTLLVKKDQIVSASMAGRLVNYSLNKLSPDHLYIYGDASE